MKIRTKVLVGLTLLLGIVLAQGLIEYRHAITTQRDLNRFESASLRKLVLAHDLHEAATAIEFDLVRIDSPDRTSTLDMITVRLPTHLARARQVAAAAASLARESSDRPARASDQSELRLLRDLTERLDHLAQQWEAFRATSIGATPNFALLQPLLVEIRQEVIPRAHRFRAESLDEVTAFGRAIRTHSENTSNSYLGAAAAACAIAALARFWLVRTVTKPLDDAVDAANDITGGNLNRRLLARGNDEFAVLASSFNHMLDKLAATADARDALRLVADARAMELDTFFNVSIDSLIITNNEGRFVRINSAFSSLLAYSPADLIDRSFLDFVHPDDHELTRTEFAKIQRGDPSTDFANRQRCRDGSLKWISWRIRPHLASGLLYAVGRDVTTKQTNDLALAESREALRQLNDRLEHLVTTRTQKLRESEERFRRLVDGVKDYAIFMLDAHGLVVSWNRGAERIKGYVAADIVGSPFSRFYRPEDIIQGRPARALATAETEGRYEETEWRLRNDGRPFRAHMVITAVRDDAGVLQGFANITRDITEQQKSTDDLLQQQDLLRLVLENLAEGVVACDMDGNLTFFNKTARDWHGTDITRAPPQKWSGSFDLFAADGVTRLPTAEIPLVRAAAGERVRNAEMVITLRDHPPRHIVASGDGLQDAAGKMVGAVVVMHDITERKNAERNNLRTQRLESIGTLSGGIAHDLNNALAPILMGIELLRTRYPDSQSFLRAMETSARRGAGMVKQLLTFAKGVDGERTTLDPRPLITEIESIIARTFPKNIEHRVVFGENLRPILGDATQIHQVLLNLCVNARDAMPEGGLLTIEAQNHTIDALYASGVPELKPGAHVRLQIRDTGTGIPPDILERIFDPFFSTKPADLGTGLGLSTVIGIVRSHAGCVQVYSVPGEGTQFSVYLPVAEAGVPTSVSPFAPGIDFAGDRRLILVVEDEPAVREIARAVLLSLDFQVITANDGADALALLVAEHAPIALIITDLHMPRMDGVEFVKQARALLPEVPIIASSGRLEKADADRLSDLGVRALLHKPFTQGDLVQSLNQVFSRSPDPSPPAPVA